MDFMMGLVSKKHQAYNPYSFQSIARESRPDLGLYFIEQGPFSMACSAQQVGPGVWRLGPNEDCFLEVRFEERPFHLEIRQDKWGTRPCFYLEDHEKFIFSTDFNVLTKFMGESAEVDRNAIAEYLKTGLLFGEQTIFQDIKMLPLKHFISFNRKNVELKKQKWPRTQLGELSAEEKIKACFNCFEKSVNDWMNYVETSSGLTGDGADTPQLTGLYDRELVGREILTALDFYFQNDSSITDKEVEQLLELKSFKSKMIADRTFEFCVEALFHSFFTDIYEDDKHNNWSMPHQFIQENASPFWNSQLIDHLIALGAEVVEVPFKNVITFSGNEFEKINPTKRNKLSRVELEKQNARVGIFCPQVFGELLLHDDSSLLLRRCLKINRLMDELGIVSKNENWLQRLWTKLALRIVLSTMVLFLLFTPKLYAQRSELDRYTQWHDRLALEKEQLNGTKGERIAHYLELDFTLSDGLLGLIGEVETQTQLGSTSAEKTQNILNLINQNINSERLVDAFLGAGLPLPVFRLADIEFTPSAFYQHKLGVSFSFSNQADATDPRAQIYLKMDRKIGISTLLETSSAQQWWLAVYQLERQDFSSERSAQDIAEDEKVFDLDQLERTQKSWELDLRFRTELYRYISYTIGVDEITLNQTSEHDSAFGKRPLWYQQFDYQRGDYRLYAGHHFRERYSIADGLYVGGLWHLVEGLPIRFKTHLTTETLSLGGVLETGDFMIQYVYQTPHQNPQDDLWAYSLHKISLALAF